MPDGTKLKRGIKDDLHDIAHDVFAPLQQRHPELALELDIAAFQRNVDNLAGRVGRPGAQRGLEELTREIGALHIEAGRILKELVYCEEQQLLERFVTERAKGNRSCMRERNIASRFTMFPNPA